MYRGLIRVFHLLMLCLLCGSLADALCVSSFQARLYEQPSAASGVSWVVGKYMPLLEIGRKGNWLRVKDLEGVVHWVSSSEVSRRLRCVVVKVKSAGLRKGPSARSAAAELRTVDKYTAFMRIESNLEDEGDFMFVQDETGAQYWLNANQVWRPSKVSSVGF